jgi:hypothetical protein
LTILFLCVVFFKKALTKIGETIYSQGTFVFVIVLILLIVLILFICIINHFVNIINVNDDFYVCFFFFVCCNNQILLVAGVPEAAMDSEFMLLTVSYGQAKAENLNNGMVR